MSSRTPAVRMTKTATLRAAANKPRNVGREAGKPKPGPAPKVKITPPSYEDQDQESGQVDGPQEASDVIEDDEEEEIEEEVVTQAAPSLPPKKGTPRSKFSAPSKPKDGYVDGRRAAAPAPHMKLLSLVSDYKPVPSKPARFFEFIPDMFRLFAMHAAVASLLSPLKPVHKNDPTYNPVFSRLALSYAALYIILCARKACSKLTYNERKVLKALEEGFDFTTLMIPGPYVLFLSTFGFHLPADRRFDAICPKIDIEDKETKPKTKTLNPQFPHFPALLTLASYVAGSENANGDSNLTRKGKGKPEGTTTGTSTDHYAHWTNNEITLVNDKVDFDGTWSLWGNNVVHQAHRDTSLRPMSQNCALAYRFHATRLDLVKARDSLPIDDIPYPAHNAETADDLLTWFGIKSDVRWMATVMESLEYEAKFFDGSATLGSIGFENGQNVLCVSEIHLGPDSVDGKWFASLRIKDVDVDVDDASPHLVKTMMENVSDSEMAIANLTGTVTQYVGGHATGNLLKDKCSVGDISTIPKTGVHAYSSHARKYIRDAPNLAHRFRSHIKTEMMKRLDDVL
uniref:Capsid protein n=1 Tax=Rosellinia necatrix partitivirus 26 TaxID=2759761 RepID=A0A7G4WLZ9_9VIRU|nr:capsid protein [Rosellinia necatrix partitivirus 26]